MTWWAWLMIVWLVVSLPIGIIVGQLFKRNREELERLGYLKEPRE